MPLAKPMFKSPKQRNHQIDPISLYIYRERERDFSLIALIPKSRRSGSLGVSKVNGSEEILRTFLRTPLRVPIGSSFLESRVLERSSGLGAVSSSSRGPEWPQSGFLELSRVLLSFLEFWSARVTSERFSRVLEGPSSLGFLE